MNKRIKATLSIAHRHHPVQLQARPGTGVVRLELARESRREAKGDQSLTMTPTQCRELMRALQGAADEADRLAYERDKHRPELDVVVEQLAEKGIR